MGYRDIHQSFLNSIAEGALKPGARVPSIRSLATELGCSKRTVESAYDRLLGEGTFISRGQKP